MFPCCLGSVATMLHTVIGLQCPEQSHQISLCINKQAPCFPFVQQCRGDICRLNFEVNFILQFHHNPTILAIANISLGILFTLGQLITLGAQIWEKQIVVSQKKCNPGMRYDPVRTEGRSFLCSYWTALEPNTLGYFRTLLQSLKWSLEHKVI